MTFLAQDPGCALNPYFLRPGRLLLSAHDRPCALRHTGIRPDRHGGRAILMGGDVPGLGTLMLRGQEWHLHRPGEVLPCPGLGPPRPTPGDGARGSPLEAPWHPSSASQRSLRGSRPPSGPKGWRAAAEAAAAPAKLGQAPFVPAAGPLRARTLSRLFR